jgi:competence protein ComFC
MWWCSLLKVAKGDEEIKLISQVQEQLGSLCCLVREIFFPRVCYACGVEIEDGWLCPECRRGLLVGKTLPPREELAGVWMLFAYDQAVKEAIHKIKFAGDRELPELLGSEAALLLDTQIWPDFLQQDAVVTGIPTDASRRQARGFDLPEVLFKQALVRQGFTWQELLRRKRPTEPLFSLNPEARSLCLADCFQVLGDVRGKKIILTDDIFTTGATMQEAARTLKAAGAVSIAAVTFAGALDNLG